MHAAYFGITIPSKATKIQIQHAINKEESKFQNADSDSEKISQVKEKQLSVLMVVF